VDCRAGEEMNEYAVSGLTKQETYNIGKGRYLASYQRYFNVVYIVLLVMLAISLGSNFVLIRQVIDKSDEYDNLVIEYVSDDGSKILVTFDDYNNLVINGKRYVIDEEVSSAVEEDLSAYQYYFSIGKYSSIGIAIALFAFAIVVHLKSSKAARGFIVEYEQQVKK
jgi:hypothetical protein